MSASIILIAYHADRWLPACLASLAGASARRMHLVLVDNSGNTVLYEQDLSPFKAEILTTPRPLGFAEANNFALTRAGHLEEVVLFLNQDTISPPGWIDRCLEALAGDPSLGAVSPLIRTYDDDGWDPSFTACLSEAQRRRLDEEPDAAGWEVEVAPAPALLVRTPVLRQVGPFDPIYGSYYEDYDLCRRIRRAGYRIAFVPSARVRHFSGSTTDTPEKERRRMRLLLRNRLIYRLREDRRPRWLELARFFGHEVPHRLIRGLLRTPSSQPPDVVLQAARDVGGLIGRLGSRTNDTVCWQSYLRQIEWLSRS
ncbi:glycosyltransferase family 2 protein [Rhodocaloribacter litoris]|uniref:glycosyltransferase family 2 protein n=1 Tax=Rhodocaloribacter litoris TaxID=2558931 RepID=UPI00141E008D|nr:glycosyltransferase family 2 protein [Rhodocaloribacter litoris]QXD16184.1 glycosyltransferase family 2 protein [Rhodocaloribacter litoris]